MSLPNKQIGWSNESNLLWQVAKQIQHLTKATTTITGTVNQGTANTIANAWPIKLTDGTNTATVNSNGSITVSGISAVGIAPVNPPVGISGTDAGGLKRSILTDTSGRQEINTIQSLPLPAGASTSALQTSGNASLTSIDSKVLTDAQLRATPVPFSPRPNTTGTNGTTPYKLISLATTNAVSLKNSGGNLYSILAIGLTSTVRYLKLYNKASVPTVGTDVPVMTIPVPANTQGAGVALAFSIGVNFPLGIAFAITSGSADSDTGAVGAGDVILNLTYA
jgi:hypothetical protein